MDAMETNTDPQVPADMSLEEWGRQQAEAAGFDPGSPQVQQRIGELASQVRATVPGKDDAEIIAKAGPTLSAALEAPKGPGTASAIQQAMQKLQEDFSPDKEREVRQQVHRNRTWDQAAQAASLYGRMVANPQQAQVFQQLDQQQAARSNEPMVDWQTKKAAAIQGIEQQIKLGQISREEVQAQVTRLGLEQALDERKTRQDLAKAEADPLSATSEAMRQLARKFAPEFVSAMGDRFNGLTAAQLKGQLPALEKQYLKELEIGQKRLELLDKAADRSSRERIAAGNNAAVTGAAAIRAAAQDRATAARLSAGTADKPLKPSEALAIDKEEGKVGESLAGAQDTLANFDRLEKLIRGGLSTGPVVGGDNVVGSAIRFVSKDRQAADSVVKNIVSSASKTFGANPTEGERRYIEMANSVMQLDDPLPRLAELRSKFEELVRQRQARLESLAKLRGGTPRLAPPAAPKNVPTVNSKGWVLMTDRGGNRAYVSPDGSQFEEVQ